jgi:hypothetical protein
VSWELKCSSVRYGPDQVLPSWEAGRDAMAAAFRSLLKQDRSLEDDLDLKEALEILRNAVADRPLRQILQLDAMPVPVTWSLRETRNSAE